MILAQKIRKKKHRPSHPIRSNCFRQFQTFAMLLFNEKIRNIPCFNFYKTQITRKQEFCQIYPNFGLYAVETSSKKSENFNTLIRYETCYVLVIVNSFSVTFSPKTLLPDFSRKNHLSQF